MSQFAHRFWEKGMMGIIFLIINIYARFPWNAVVMKYEKAEPAGVIFSYSNIPYSKISLVAESVNVRVALNEWKSCFWIQSFSADFKM